MAPRKTDLLQGTLELLILRTLADGPMHGFGVAKRIEEVSDALLRVEHGSLYPALYRLEEQGAIEPEWGVSENNRKVKYYKLTRIGRRQLEHELGHWRRMATGVERVLAGAEG
jgi:transcriptional regulator